MGKFLLKRLTVSIFTLFLALTIVFFMVRAIPGNPLYAIAGTEQGMSAEDFQRLAETYGLAGSVWEQYINYLKNILTGNWGISFFMGVPVFEGIKSRLEVTLMLSIMSMIITVIIGIPTGVLAATHENSLLDYILSSTSMVFLCIPNFILGILLIYVFGYKLQWFPISNYLSIEKHGIWQAIYSLILPAFALGMTNAAQTARYTRTAMLAVMKRDYIRTAKAKGLSMNAVRYKHALKNAFGTVLTTLTGALLGSLGGSVVVETVFNLHGLGSLLSSAVSQQDYPLLQADILVLTLMFIVLNILLDIGYKLLDPRVELN